MGGARSCPAHVGSLGAPDPCCKLWGCWAEPWQGSPNVTWVTCGTSPEQLNEGPPSSPLIQAGVP